ncbi:MAG: hypothetical protein ACK53Y_02955, partial [bacterium]
MGPTRRREQLPLACDFRRPIPLYRWSVPRTDHRPRQDGRRPEAAHFSNARLGILPRLPSLRRLRVASFEKGGRRYR